MGPIKFGNLWSSLETVSFYIELVGYLDYLFAFFRLGWFVGLLVGWYLATRESETWWLLLRKRETAMWSTRTSTTRYR